MRTVYTTLPIFDSTDKQDYTRTGQKRPIYSPRHALPPFQFETGNSMATIDEILLVDCSGGETDITGYFNATPAVFNLTDDYVQYKGDALNTPLPLGSYYLQMTTDNDEVFYSDYISIENIYPNQIDGTAWSDVDGYGTFTVSGAKVTSAINAGGTAYGVTDESFSVVSGERILIFTTLTLNSGDAPSIRLDKGGAAASNTIILSDGVNAEVFTATKTGVVKIRIFNPVLATNYSTSEIFILRESSDRFIKMTFSNTQDLPTPTNEPTILYHDGWEDIIWFPVELNTPEHETVIIGEEKNGHFIAEKIVTKYNYKIIDYIGRNLYRALHRLPLHDQVEVIDRVGNVYDIEHDVTVDPMEWNYWDMGTLTIRFHDEGSYWTGSLTNLS